jgi:RecJ-like exonuclease
MAKVWFKDAQFDHAAHRSFTCVSCHTKAAVSTQTAEVLVPGIATCQTCHSGNPQQAGKSDNRCFECHDYHDWKQQPMFKGRYNINQLRSRRSGD